MIWYAGMSSSFLAILMWQNWITINMKQINKDLKYISVRAENEGWMDKIRKFVLTCVPTIAGFSGAFYYGYDKGA